MSRVKWLVIAGTACLVWCGLLYWPRTSSNASSALTPRLVLHTDGGDLVCKLYPQTAPRTVEQILRLVRGGCFDTARFQVKGGLARLGFGPLSKQQQDLVRPIVGEFASIKHRRGILTLCRDLDYMNSATGEFEVVLQNAPSLDGRRTVFGEVESGWDVLSRMERATVCVVRAEADAAGRLASEECAGAVADKRESGQADAVTDEVRNGEHVKTVVFRNFPIDGVYANMEGPKRFQNLNMGTPQDRYVWITRFGARLLDSKSGAPTQENLCHAGLQCISTPTGPHLRHASEAQVAMSQGQYEIAFPPGFAMRVSNSADRQERVTVQLVNSEPAVHRMVDLKATLHYVNDAAAARRKLAPLFLTCADIMPLVEPNPNTSETVQKTAHQSLVNTYGDGCKRSLDWMVPSGRHELTQDVTERLGLSRSTSIHSIWLHVHPYAESVELRDATVGRTVWKGAVRNAFDGGHARIVSADSYCSAAGLPLFQGHRYQVRAVYNNRLKEEIPAMAGMWLFVSDNLHND